MIAHEAETEDAPIGRYFIGIIDNLGGHSQSSTTVAVGEKVLDQSARTVAVAFFVILLGRQGQCGAHQVNTRIDLLQLAAQGLCLSDGEVVISVHIDIHRLPLCLFGRLLHCLGRRLGLGLLRLGIVAASCQA